MSDEKSFQYVKILLPLFRAVVKFCSTNRLATVFLVFSTCIIINISFKTISKFNLYRMLFAVERRISGRNYSPVIIQGERKPGRSKKGGIFDIFQG